MLSSVTALVAENRPAWESLYGSFAADKVTN
jgi:hypothetical protein